VRVSGICEPERQVLLAEERLDPDGRGGLRTEADPVVGDAEVDPHVRAVELDPGDVADLDARDPDVVAVADAARLCEGGAVAVAATDDRQAGRVERQDEEQDDDEQAHDAEAQGVLVLQRAAHRPHLAASTV
jgi:hypothetical protein